MRHIVIAVDGTQKKGGMDERNTNVHRVTVCINNSENGNAELFCLYLPGIATEGNGLWRFINTVTGHGVLYPYSVPVIIF